MKRDRVSEFFRTKVASFVQKPMARLVLAVIFLSWVGVSIWQASKIEPTKENEQFLAEDHPLQRSITILDKEFPTVSDITCICFVSLERLETCLMILYANRFY